MFQNLERLHAFKGSLSVRYLHRSDAKRPDVCLLACAQATRSINNSASMLSGHKNSGTMGWHFRPCCRSFVLALSLPGPSSKGCPRRCLPWSCVGPRTSEKSDVAHWVRVKKTIPRPHRKQLSETSSGIGIMRTEVSLNSESFTLNAESNSKLFARISLYTAKGSSVRQSIKQNEVGASNP